MLSDLTPKEKMQLDTQKGLHFGLREHIDMVIEEQVIKLNNEIKNIVRNHPDMKTSEVLASARMLLGADLPQGPKFRASMERKIQRWRKPQRRKIEEHPLEEDAMSEEGEEDLSQVSGSSSCMYSFDQDSMKG